jgi:hypothetical protein
MSAQLARLERLEEAVRVRPNRAAVQMLREAATGMTALAGTDAERIEAHALTLLIEMHDKIVKALT